MKKSTETQYQDTEVLYLISLIKSAIRGEAAVPLPEVPDGLDWQRLYNIVKRHMVTAMVYPCVKSVGGCPADLHAKWKQKADMALIKELQYDAEREIIFEEFDKNGIDYLPLKGIIIKDFYPRKGMRQFSDNDILYRRNDDSKVREIMLSLGYVCDESNPEYSVESYHKDPFFIFELHRELFSFRSSMREYFSDAWARAIKDERGCAYHMTDEDFYVFFLAHFYKHYKEGGGCGLRFFSDLYLIQHKLNNLNRDYIDECLKETGMTEFEKEVTNISESFFGDGSIEIDGASLKYIIESGAYGTSEHAIGDQMRKEGKFISVLKMLFPSLKEMQLRYKVLRKVPILLPVFYFVRWFSILFTGRKRAKIKIAIKKFFKRK